ncbi:shugoshin 1 isoform X2 [Gadus chalcogrammus]|uniref:shugoshin 1 isoform X2 n=1 Tax=Gadus chalcogrammus TaxID=1042646 RepID=UPI0024C4A900|nr:shugoshin 1 isoform X2 [Gadus chalcogrammus]
MARERGQKKSFKQSLDDIKEKMRDKRTKRLAGASAPRGKRINKTNVCNSSGSILQGVQQNNTALALALQAEKEKLRQAYGVVLQLKREQQALFLHLLLLKRRLRDQELTDQDATARKCDSTSIEAASHNPLELSRQTQITSHKSPVSEEEPAVIQGPPAPEEAGETAFVFTLPSTVGVRRRRAESCTRRRSQQTQQRRSFSKPGGSVDTMAEGMLVAGGLLTASPIHSDCSAQNPRASPPGGATAGPADPIGSDRIQHSTPEPLPAISTHQPQPRKKHTQQQQPQRVKQEPAARNPERSRKGERGPLKKPWENTKVSRTRSKSRDRSARPPAAQGPPADNLNTSLGFNDTFDFDCEEAVHLTPFKAKAEAAQAEAAQAETAVHRDGEGESPLTTLHAGTPGESPPGEPPLSSPESEGELYVPRRGRRKRSSPEKSRTLPGRRGRRVTRVVLHPQQEVSVFRDKETENTAMVQESKAPPCPESPDWMSSRSPAPKTANQESPSELQQASVLVVTPGLKAEMMRIDSVLSISMDPSSSDPTTPALPSKRPRKTTNICKKPYLKVPGAGSRPSDGSTPSRKRRCTLTVDYKEPSLGAKLRRGDKHTDLQFLRSPIFKPSPGARRSVKGASRKSQQPLLKYNESFVGCR